MNIDLELFGVLRGHEPGDRLHLEVPGQRVSDLRSALVVHASAHWPGLAPGMLAKCAFATTTDVLRDGDALPTDARMAVLPPVSGG